MKKCTAGSAQEARPAGHHLDRFRLALLLATNWTAQMLQRLNLQLLRVSRVKTSPMSTSWKAEHIPQLSDKRFLITGANSGIGFYTALKLARKDAELILACRDLRKGEAALTRLRDEAPGVRAELAELDLASLASVREFAGRELERQRPLHVLINNAGVMAVPQRTLTADGFEMQFGTNVLGHFALTGLLWPAIERAAVDAPPRVVTIASIAHKRTHLENDDLQSSKNYSPMRAYQQSKLANLMLALEMSRRLRAKGSPILSVAAHPGVAATALFRTDQRSATAKVLRRAIGYGISLFLNDEAEGALPTLFAATSPDAKNGGYYGPQQLGEMKGEVVGPAKIADHARNEELAAQLWSKCRELTGVDFA
jgi:NAD(P)-dependent dehydrogenase (short-subunit alcohol dehydrogenase family)